MSNDKLHEQLENLHKSQGAILQWQRDHERHDDARFKRLEETMANIPRKEDIQEIMQKTIGDSLLNAGKLTKMTILTIATLIGAVAVIGGGLKAVLGWLGIGFITK